MKIDSLTLENLQLTIIRHPLIVKPEVCLTDVVALINRVQNHFQSLPIKDINCLNNSRLELDNITPQAVSCVLVMENSQLVGIITQHDLIKLTAERKNLESISVAEVMTKELVTLNIKEFKDVFIALNLLKQHRIRHLPILGEQGELLGLVTPTSLLAVSIQQAGLYNYARVKLAERQRIEAELRLERNFVSAVLNLADALVVVLNRQGRIVRFNHTCEQATGYTFDEVKGKFIWDVLLLPQTQEYIKAVFDNLATKEFPKRYETYLVTKDSDRSLISWSNNVLLNRNDQVEYIVCTGIDITESRKAQAELQQTRNFLQSMIDNLPVGVFVKDAKPETFGKFRLWNHACERIFGITAQQAIDKTDYEFFSKEQADFSRQKDQETFDSGIPQDISEEPINSHSLGQRILHTTKIPLYDKDQQPEYLLCIAEDITEHKQAKEQLQTVLDAVPGFVSWVSSDGYYLGVNRQLAENFNLTTDAFVGKELGFLKNSPQFTELIRDFLAKQDVAISSMIDAQVDGTIRNYLVIAQKYQQNTAAVAIGIDITERKQNEVALQSLIESTAYTTGHDFFPALVEYISTTLDVRQTLVTELIDGQVRTLGLWSDGQLQPNIYNDPKLKPCKFLWEQGSYHCASTIQESHNTTQRWATIQGESSMGVILSDDLGNQIGSLCIVDEKPILDPQKFEGILKVFAARASAELQRQRAQEALQQLNRDLEARVEQRTLELQKNEAQLRAIFQQVAVGIKLQTVDGNFLKVNQKLCEILGYSQEELLEKNFRDITHPEDIQSHLYNLQKLIAGDVETFSVEKRYLHKNGNIIWVNLTVSLIRDANGKPIYAIGVVQDIRDRKQAEEELKRQFATVEAAIDGIAILSQDAYSYLNKANLEMFGYSYASELIGKSWQEIYYPEEINRFQSEVLPVVMQQKHWRGEAIAKRKDGTSFEQEVSLTLSEQGDLICVSRDISQRKAAERLIEEQRTFLQIELNERKQAEAELRQVKERLQFLISSSPAVIFSAKISTPNFCTTYISENVINLVGYSAEDFLFNPNLWLERIHPEDAAKVVKNSPRFFPQKGCHHQEYRWMHRDGEYRWMLEELKLVQDEYGHPLEIIGLWIDISDRKQAEENICKALEKEKELNELKSRFISMTSHEFRTPLAVITSSAGILKSFSHKLDDQQKQKHLQCIQTYVQHTTQLLDDILLINKAECGKLAFNPSYLDLGDFCHSLVEEIQISSPNHTLNFYVQYLGNSCTNSQFTACMDKKLLRQILSNLLSNAVKYSALGSYIQIDLIIQNQSAVFIIADEGIGISSEEQPNLFEPFYRASNVGNIPGTGLGLAIVNKCVNLHSGRITVASQVGVGTTFRVELPLITMKVLSAELEVKS